MVLAFEEHILIRDAINSKQNDALHEQVQQVHVLKEGNSMLAWGDWETLDEGSGQLVTWTQMIPGPKASSDFPVLRTC